MTNAHDCTVTAADGTTITVHVSGPESGIPLVLLHGVGSSSLSYDWLMPDLEGRQVFRVDARGHGSSARAPGTYTLPHYFDDAVLVLEQLVKRPAIAAGFSMGGMVAWRLAQRRPDLLVAVFLEEPIVFIEETYAGPLPQILRHTIEQEMDWEARGLDADAASAELADNPAGPGILMRDILHADGVRTLAISTMIRDRGTMEAAIDATMSAGIDTELPLRVPAEIIAGGNAGGSAFPTRDAAVIALSHPEIPVHRVEDAGHDLHNSFAGRETYRSVLLDFLVRFGD